MLLLAACVLSATHLHGQSVKAAFNAFRDSVLNQQLVLRNFSGETTVHAAWTGAQFELDQPKWRTFGVLQTRSVKMKGDEVQLQCERHVLARNGSDSLEPYSVVDSVYITVDLNGGDAGQLLPQLRGAIFYSSTADALAAIPKPLQSLVPGHTQANPAVGWPSCDCDKGAACATRPIVVYTEAPAYSEEGAKRKINGSVVTAFIVDEAGHAHDVWITQPLGYGMDEKAAEVASTYRFQPATCHGKAVSVPLTTEINFQIF